MGGLNENDKAKVLADVVVIGLSVQGLVPRSGVSQATVHVVTTLGSVNLEYFLWRAIGKVNCNYGTAPNVSGIYER
ncbi:hypothetical protein FQA39_LY07649 [Lamprigera yunnana]|nr:hypothetical protein FQA39_LY07649 [Lamprigera yunnana]